MLTIAQILPALNSGGVERGTLEVASELVRRGHRSIVISAPGRLLEPLKRAGSQHVAWPVGKKSPFTLRWVRPLRKLLEREDVDILHARSRVPAWVAYLAWRGMNARTRPRFVTTVHALYSVNAYSAVMTFGERVIAVSETARSYILGNYPDVDPAKIELIYRGVDPKEFPYGHYPDEQWLRQWHEEFPHLRHARPLLTLPGRIVRQKGHDAFVRLIGQLHALGIPAHGLIVGSEKRQRDRFKAELMHEIAERKLGNHMTFTGDRADMRDIYAVSDIVFSLHTLGESFGRTVVEALTIGTPVIGYDVGGVGETLGELLPAGRVPPDDEATLLERTTQFLRNRPEVLPNTVFTRQAMLDQTLALYGQMAGTG